MIIFLGRSVVVVRSTFFWTDKWIGDVPLCDWYSRLYALAEKPLCSVAEMHHLGWDEGRSVEVETTVICVG
jgi:hypothetical protein